MNYYAAIYHLNSVDYASFIYATDRHEAKRIAHRRNIGEEILGVMKSQPEFNPQPLPSAAYFGAAHAPNVGARLVLLISTAHLISFYGWIASRARIVDATTHILSDQGMLHEILHEIQFPEEYGFRLALYENLQNLEESIPGLFTSQYRRQCYQIRFLNDIRVKRDLVPL